MAGKRASRQWLVLLCVMRSLLRCLWVVVLGSSLLGFVATTTGCAATAVTVPNPESLTFQDLLDLERKAYFRRQELDARQTAHLMGQKVGGSSCGNNIRVDDPSAPEGYTVDGQPGTSAWQFHMGYAAQRMIAEHYAATHPVRQFDQRANCWTRKLFEAARKKSQSRRALILPAHSRKTVTTHDARPFHDHPLPAFLRGRSV